MCIRDRKVTVRGQVYTDMKILKSVVLRLAKEFIDKNARPLMEGDTSDIIKTNSNDLLNTVETATPALLASMAEEYMNKLENAVVEAVKEELEDDDMGNSLCEVEAKLDDGAADPVSTLSLPFAIHDQLRTSLAFGQVNVEKLANNRHVYLAQLSSQDGDTSSLKGMPISADPNPLLQHWQKHWEEEREAEEQNAMNSEDPMYKQRKGPNRLQPSEQEMLKKNVEEWWDEKRAETKLSLIHISEPTRPY